MSKRTTKLSELSTYVDSSIVAKIIKKRGQRGLISTSAYLRELIMKDLEIKE
jgi:hypothetical protein